MYFSTLRHDLYYLVAKRKIHAKLWHCFSSTATFMILCSLNIKSTKINVKAIGAPKFTAYLETSVGYNSKLNFGSLFLYQCLNLDRSETIG